MSKIILYAHGGSGNHGCEAIVRSTAEMLRDYEKILISSAPEEDTLYRIGGLFRLVKDIQPYQKASPDFIAAYLALKLRHNYIPLDKLDYKNPLRKRKREILPSLSAETTIAMPTSENTPCFTIFFSTAERKRYFGAAR